MVVAWSKDKVGRAVGDLIIRDPVVLTATLPRFLLSGDRGTMHLDLDNVAGQPGDYRLEMQSEGVNVVGNAAPHTLKLNAGSTARSRPQRRRRQCGGNGAGRGQADDA
jgi:uncharacterized protein YfaS (alpha-2-macroglobulin family)